MSAMEIQEAERVRVAVTGKRGVGKSTVCEKALRILRAEGWLCGGILTRKVRDSSGSLRGIEVLDVSRDPPDARTLARTDDPKADGPRIGPYRFLQAGLSFGRDAIRRGFSEAEVLFGDELGYLELQGKGFHLLFEALAAETGPHMAVVVRSDLLDETLVVRSDLLDETLGRLGAVEIRVLEVTTSNRDQVAPVLCRLLTSACAHPEGR